MTKQSRKKRRRIPDGRRKTVLGRAQCLYCGNTSGPFQVDHRIPLARGGSNALDNLECACCDCNFEKWDMLVDEWREQRLSRGLSWPPPVSVMTMLRRYAAAGKPL